jgi:hypothetical protein
VLFLRDDFLRVDFLAAFLREVDAFLLVLLRADVDFLRVAFFLRTAMVR